MLINTNPWTDEERKTLQHLRKNGVSVKECAKRLGRSYHSVDAALRRAGIQMPKQSSLPTLQSLKE